MNEGFKRLSDPHRNSLSTVPLFLLCTLNIRESIYCTQFAALYVFCAFYFCTICVTQPHHPPTLERGGDFIGSTMQFLPEQTWHVKALYLITKMAVTLLKGSLLRSKQESENNYQCSCSHFSKLPRYSGRLICTQQILGLPSDCWRNHFPQKEKYMYAAGSKECAFFPYSTPVSSKGIYRAEFSAQLKPKVHNSWFNVRPLLIFTRTKIMVCISVPISI